MTVYSMTVFIFPCGYSINIDFLVLFYLLCVFILYSIFHVY